MKPGMKYLSTVCDTQVMVIRSPPEPLDLCCGGVAMVGPGGQAPAGALDEAFAAGTLMGKRYVDAAERIELLCTKAGRGSLSLGEAKLLVKQPKALPSSD
jgi:hypothetical protein